MVSFESSDLKKIGVALTTFGILSILAGALLFFNKTCLTTGNILFIFGVIMTLGPHVVLQYLLKLQNYKGSLSFGIGFFFVIIVGWPIIGMIVETYGFTVLFRAFWPTVTAYMKNLPIIGRIIRQSNAQILVLEMLIERKKNYYLGRQVPRRYLFDTHPPRNITL